MRRAPRWVTLLWPWAKIELNRTSRSTGQAIPNATTRAVRSAVSMAKRVCVNRIRSSAIGFTVLALLGGGQLEEDVLQGRPAHLEALERQPLAVGPGEQAQERALGMLDLEAHPVAIGGRL